MLNKIITMLTFLIFWTIDVFLYTFGIIDGFVFIGLVIFAGIIGIIQTQGSE